MACTEPQCLYKGALYFTVELYLYYPYEPYGLYRASVPVQGCTLPFLYLFYTFPIFPNKEILMKHNFCTIKMYNIISYSFCSSTYTAKSNMALTDHGYDVSLPVS